MEGSIDYVDTQAYEPPVSVWKLVEQHISPSEQPVVKAVLGESLVDQSLELQEEICTLLDIWREYRAETQQNVFHARLPEPPAVRDRLKQEILFFVGNIREKAKENLRDPDTLLAKHNPELLDYAAGTPRPGSVISRPSTSHSRDGRETPLVTCSPASHRDKTLAVENLSDKLNAFNVDDVAQHLRETLEEEVEMLLTDIEFLQKCLDNEADYRSTTDGFEEPSLQDLRDARSKLEKEWFKSDAVLAGVHKDKQSASDAKRLVPRKGSAGSTRSNLSSAGSVRGGPMRAKHDISVTGVPTPPSVPYKKDSTINKRHKVVSHRISDGDVVSGSAKNVISNNAHKSSNPKGKQNEPQSVEPLTNRENTESPLPRPSSAQRFRKMVLDCREGT